MGMVSKADHFAALGLPVNSSAADIAAAFRRLARQHHPDKGGSREVFQRVRTAYEALQDSRPSVSVRFRSAKPQARSEPAKASRPATPPTRSEPSQASRPNVPRSDPAGDDSADRLRAKLRAEQAAQLAARRRLLAEHAEHLAAERRRREVQAACSKQRASASNTCDARLAQSFGGFFNELGKAPPKKTRASAAVLGAESGKRKLLSSDSSTAARSQKCSRVFMGLNIERKR